MGFFNKKEKKSKKKEALSALPELPKLPEFPKIKEESIKTIPQLPSFPTNALGEKFSQSTIKEAITGKKEGEEVFESDDFATEDENELRRMKKPLRKPLTKELYPINKGRIPKRKIYGEFEKATKRIEKIEPIFIRIDKFEESLHTIEKTKKQILEIEKMLREIIRIKEAEEKELTFWEREIQTIKRQIEKVDKNIFSKIE